jgi:hypothetical protein
MAEFTSVAKRHDKSVNWRHELVHRSHSAMGDVMLWWQVG